MKELGIHALVSLMTYFLTIMFAFKAVQALNFEKLLRRDQIFAAQVLLVFIAIALGFEVGNFIMTLVDQSQALRYLF